MNNLVEDLTKDLAACAIFVHRAHLSAEKTSSDPAAVVRAWLRKPSKIQSALESAEGLRPVDAVHLIIDEREEYSRRRHEESLHGGAVDSAALRVIEKASMLLPNLNIAA